MKQDVRLSYRSKGLKAPVYIVTSLSEPQWDPVELTPTISDDGELEFWHVFPAEEGEYQYKFRLGPGDWWALDETKPTVDDGFGNRNNVINVEAVRAALPPRPELKLQDSKLPTSTPAESSKPSLDITSDRLPSLNTESQKPNEEKIDYNKSIYQQLSHGQTPPLTPPMTPEMTDSNVHDNSKFQPFPVIEIQRPSSPILHKSDTKTDEPVSISNDDRNEVEVLAPEHLITPQPNGLFAAMKYFLISFGSWMMNIAGGGLRMTGILAIAVGLAAVVYKIREVRDTVIPTVLSMFFPTWLRRMNGTDDSMV